MKTSIKTLEELYAEKKKLKMQIEDSKREFIQSFSYTKAQSKDFFLNKVALPASAIGLATLGISKLAGLSNNNHQVAKAQTNNRFFLKIVPIVLPMIQAYFSKEGKKLDPAGWLNKIISTNHKGY